MSGGARPADEPIDRWDLRLAGPAAGAWAGALGGLDRPPVLAVVLAGGLAAVLFWRRPVARLGVLASAVMLLALWAVAGLQAQKSAADPLVAAAARGSWAELTVTVAGIPAALPAAFPGGGASTGQPAAARWRVPVTAQAAVVGALSWVPVAGVTVFGDGRPWAELVPGARIRAAGLLAADNLSAFPAVLLRARSPPTTLEEGPWWQRAGAAIRRQLAVSAGVLGPDEQGLLRGIAVGDTAAIPDALASDARTTGLTHLLAVSGSHFAVLCGATVLLLRRAGRRAGAVGGMVTVGGLVILVGPQPSVLRAAVMGAVALLAILVGRPRAALPALCTGVMLLLVLDPSLAQAPGFVLSVQATAGLAMLAPTWSLALRKRGWPVGAADALAVPLAAGLVTAPVIAALSGAVSVVGIPANILVAPVVAASLVIGVLCAVAGPLWPAAGTALAGLDGPLLSWIAGVAHRLAHWPDASIPWPATAPGVLILSGLLIALALALRGRRMQALLAAATAGAALVLVPTRVVPLVPQGWPPPGWLLVGCEVGQGDGMVLSTGEPGVAVVVDAGPDPASISGCLDRLGVSTLPLVVLTHLHADHVNGLPGVLPGRSLGGLAVGPDRSSPGAWRIITATASARSVPVLDFRPGTSWRSGELTLQVLGPAGPFHGTDSDPANDSVVIMATIREIRILMTGDIQIEAQQDLLNRGVDLRAEVMEQPHHGSAKFLAAFEAAVAPRVSVIGVGRANEYGLPSPRTLGLLAAAEVTVLRTDEQGDVAVSLRDGRIVTTARGPTLRPATGGYRRPGDRPRDTG